MKHVIAGLLVLLLVGCQSQEERLAEFEAKADAYIEKEQWAEAKIELLNIIQIAPENAEARFKLAGTLLALQEYGDALWQYREAVRLQPDNLDWREELASLELAARQLDQASEQVNYILERDPDNVRGLMLRARLRGQQSDFESMLQDIEHVLSLEPDHTGALVIGARVLSTLERYDEAEALLDRLLEVEPNAANYVLLGTFYTSRERGMEAIEAYKKATELAENPRERRAAHLSLVNLYMGLGQTKKAEEQLLAARAEAEGDDEFMTALTRFYVMTDQIGKAEEVLKERVAKWPDQPGPLVGLARFQWGMGRKEQAMASIERALTIEPDHEAAKILRSEFLLDRDDPEATAEARRLVAEVLEQNPASLRGQFAKGRLLFMDKKYEEAAVMLRRVIEEQPDEVSYYLLGSAYLGMGQLDLARAQFLSAIRENPRSVASRRQLAGLYLKSNSPAAAAQEARRALEIEPGEPRLQLLLAEAQVAQRNAEGAGETLDSMDLDDAEIPLPLRLRAAEIYVELARFEDARAVVQSILERDPKNSMALQSIINLEARAGQPTAALAALNHAIETAPEDPELYRLRGSYYMGFRRPSDGKPRFPNEAQADLLQAEQLDPKSARTQVLIGRLRNLMGADREALEAFDKAIELDPGNGEAYMLKGAVLEAQGRLDAAAEPYQKLLERPDRGGVNQRALAIAMNNLAWLLAEREKPSADQLDRALELAQDAKELMPDDPRVADTLGWVMYKRAIPSAAISLFREAIDSYEPGSPTRALTRYHLALSYEANGEPQRAIEELKLALQEAESFPNREEAEAALARLEPS